MNIEKEIFERSIILEDKLLKYGFKKDNDSLIYKKKILDDSFLVIIEFKDNIKGRVIDLEFDEEYLNYRSSNTCNSFALKVRDEYCNLLIDIRDRCCITNNYISSQSNELNEYIINKYGIKPEFLWESTPHVGVYRNKNKKWFAIVMDVSYNKVNKKSSNDNIVEIVNVKIMPNELDDLLKIDGIYEAYHMNKKNWISITLDGVIKNDLLFTLVDKSYHYVDK